MSTAPVTAVTVTVTSDGCAVVELDGQPPQQFQADDLSQARHQAVELVIAYARHIGQPITLHARDSDASHLLEIHPDGAVRHTGTAPPARQGSGSAPRILACPPTAGRQRRRWPLVAAVAATGLAVSAALWLRPAANDSAVTTAGTASTARGTAAAPTPAPAAVDAGTLGVTAAARSASPRPVPLPVAVAPVAWNSAATWQQRSLRQASRPIITWTEGASTQVAPVQRPVAPPPPPRADPPSGGPPTAEQPRPQVVINPDPVAAEPQPAPQRPAGPAMPDRPTNPINPN